MLSTHKTQQQTSLCTLIIISLSSLCNAQFIEEIVKSQLLTPNNSSINGLSVILHQDTTIESNRDNIYWKINCSDLFGPWQIQINLNSSWGFDNIYDSKILINKWRLTIN